MTMRTAVAAAGIAIASLYGLLASVEGALPPVVQITYPPPDFKLRPGKSVEVRVRAQPQSATLSSWRLVLVEANNRASEQLLSEGSRPVDDQVVATIPSEMPLPGIPYLLRLDATDSSSLTSTTESFLLVPDPQYALIPLDEGDFSRPSMYGRSIDSTGDLVEVGNRSSESVDLLDRVQRIRRPLAAHVSDSGAERLSRDGSRLMYPGDFPLGTGVGFTDVSTGEKRLLLPTVGPSFNIDATGTHIAFQQQVIPNRDSSVGRQYFFYDATSNITQQLTNDPAAIDLSGDPGACPWPSGTVPLISADGSRVVIITGATLGMAVEDPAVGCHIFIYGVPSGTWRHVIGLAREISLSAPTLSDDGRWLSFESIRPNEQGVRKGFPAILDLETAVLTDPVGGPRAFETFDSVVSGDASQIVISSEADLDPRVGNADHNLELFVFDRDTERFTQVTDTTGGITPATAGVCFPYVPGLNHDASVMVFGFSLYSLEQCSLNGPQRNGVDGLSYSRVRAVRKRPGNQGPFWGPPTMARVLAGETMQINFSGTDPDGDFLTYFAQEVDHLNIPLGSRFDDHYDGTATFSWPTRLEQVGTYTLRVALFDEGGGEQVQDITLSACSQILHDGTPLGVLAALFSSNPPVACRDADLNHDGVVTTADLLLALSR